MINTLLAKVIGTQNERELKRLRPIVARINELESSVTSRSRMRELQERRTRGVPRAASATGRVARRPAARGLRGRARGRTPRAQHAALRRAAHRRHGAARRQDRRNEDRRRQDARRDAARLPQRARRQGRARRHRQRLPRPPRLRVDGPDLPVPRHVGRRHPARAERRRAPGRLRLATSPTAPTTSSASTTCATT